MEQQIKQSTRGYILYQEKSKTFAHYTFTKNPHDTWQAATQGGFTKAELVKQGWKCVPCVVSLY